MLEAGLPPGVLNVVNGDKEAVDALLEEPDVKAIGFVGSTPVAEYVYAHGAAHGKRVQCFGGAKNHMVIMPDADMDQAVDALIGAGYGSGGERCMAISVAVPVGEATADALVARLEPRVENLRVGPSTDRIGRFRPADHARAFERVKDYVALGVREGAKLRVDGRDFKMQGYENGFYMGGCLFDEVRRRCGSTRRRIFGPVLCRGARARFERGAIAAPMMHEYGNGARDLHPRRRSRPRIRLARPRGMVGDQAAAQFRRRWPITRSAAGNARCSAISISTGRMTPSFLRKDEDR